MKKSLTSRAVDAILRRRELQKSELLDKGVTHLRPLSIRAVARRFGLDPSGLSRALARRLKEKRCPACKQVIR